MSESLTCGECGVLIDDNGGCGCYTHLPLSIKRNLVCIDPAELTRLRAENERLRRSLHEVAEEWAGAECGLPVTAQEGYAIQLAQRMWKLASDALAKEPTP